MLRTNVTDKPGAEPRERVVDAVPAIIDQLILKYVGDSNPVIYVDNVKEIHKDELENDFD